jgi:hypothetical protein
VSEEPQSPPDLNISPLRAVLTEFHEIYQELISIGFTERVAASILANMLSDVMAYRATEDDEENEDENDPDDESDLLDDPGTD